MTESALNPLQGREAALRVNQFRFSIELFRRNYEELIIFIDYFCAPSVAFSFSRVEQKWLWQEGMKEIVFLLHNFVAAAQSLVDHTRTLHRQLYEPQGKLPEYPDEVQSRFAKDPLSQFVIKLRQMAQHYRLPSIENHTQISSTGEGKAASVIIEMTLKTEDLRQFDGWNTPAKRFMDEAGPTINVRNIVQRYFAHIIEFYEWFNQKQKDVHGISPDLYHQLLTHGVFVEGRREVAEMEKGITELERKPRGQITFEDVERMFSPVFSVLDQRRLMLCVHDSRLWFEKALTAAKSRFKIPPELETRIRHLISNQANSVSEER
jgi:hypothetical protein